jgi:DNA/RNA endonuclease YhcR with UshA esterase domain
MSHCPSCGRYVGPREACPYCGARLSGRISIRIVKIVAVLLASVGVATLWFAAIHAEVPLIQVRQAGATMNMAYVRIQGRCTRAPSYDAETGYLSFWIEDDTGAIYVSAYRTETQQILEEGRVPALGDMVEVAGTLRIREEFLSLTVNAPEQLKLTRADPEPRDIGTITPEDQYLRVRIRGQVRSIYEPYAGLTLITIRDGTGAIPVAVTEDLVTLSSASSATETPGNATEVPAFEAPASEALPIGQPVEVVAAVSLYNNTPQLVPASLTDIVPLTEPMPVAAAKHIGELTTADVGQLALVRGTLTEVNPFSAGVKFTLDDTTGSIIMLVWQSVYDTLGDPTELDIGAEIQVQGELSQYRGELEVVPQLADDMQVLAAAATSAHTPTPPHPHTPTLLYSPTPTRQSLADTPSPAATPTPQETPTATVEPIPISAITAGRIGESVTVEGTVVGTASFSGGFKFTLEDGTGHIVLLIWHNVYADCWDAPEINLGATVRATGEVGQFDGELQIQPDFGGDVKVVAGASVQAAPREIGSLTGADAGQRVMIEGKIIRLEGLSSAVKVFVGDNTGETLVFIWHTVLDHIADNTKLGTPGSRVRVVGTVELYRGNLEIVPTLPNNVVVLSAP